MPSSMLVASRSSYPWSRYEQKICVHRGTDVCLSTQDRKGCRKRLRPTAGCLRRNRCTPRRRKLERYAPMSTLFAGSFRIAANAALRACSAMRGASATAPKGTAAWHADFGFFFFRFRPCNACLQRTRSEISCSPKLISRYPACPHPRSSRSSCCSCAI